LRITVPDPTGRAFFMCSAQFLIFLFICKNIMPYSWNLSVSAQFNITQVNKILGSMTE
jgi:hypothetical protein